MTELAFSYEYGRAIHRIEQLLTGSAMTNIDSRRILWRDDATAIADEWDVDYLTRRELMILADHNANAEPVGADQA